MTPCTACGTDYVSKLAADRCAEDDMRKPRKTDWLHPDDWG